MNSRIENIVAEYNALFSKNLEVDELKNMIDNRSVLLYGAGYLGITLLRGFRKIGILPVAFIDANSLKQHTTVEGLPVISPADIRELFGDVFIVISMYRKDTLFTDIKKMLNDLGHDRVVHVLELRSCRKLMENQPLPVFIDGSILIENTGAIEAMYDLLDDEISRDTLVSLLRFMFIDVNTPLKAFHINEQYFDYGVYKKMYNERFLDCGAFDGEVMEIFFRNVDFNFEKYVGFEPDPDNFLRLLRRISGMGEDLSDHITALNLALGDKAELLRFENFGQSNSAVSQNGNIEVRAVRLDDIPEAENPTFIKIDVEGYEKQVITGGLNIIRISRPVLAVAVYHKPCDLWQLPLWIHSLFPEYRIYLRSYMNLMETVCYAVPEERYVK